ncbi:helix-turn-helix domain-containing protein [Marinicrinis sediminis]|uniref:Helix-turn-helix domain-containing protein n=1 Tax=Marinicrinis sediminis TaxID=1652465 RepID=A0ABW5RE88_9BACL
MKIHLCDYSFHTEPFRQFYRDGLDTYIFRLQTEGASHVLVNGQMETILPGELLLYEPGEPYQLEASVQNEDDADVSGDYYVMCTGSWIDQWWALSPRPKRTKVAEDMRLKAIWYQLILEKRRMEDSDPALLAALLQSLCYMIDRAIQENSHLPSNPSFYALKMKYFIEEHATKRMKLEDVAAHVGLSVSRTGHLFKSEYGMSVLQYAQKVRLAIAIELMKNSPMTLEHVAEISGFGSYSYFHRIFREHYGISPGRYRKTSNKRYPAQVAQKDTSPNT